MTINKPHNQQHDTHFIITQYTNTYLTQLTQTGHTNDKHQHTYTNNNTQQHICHDHPTQHKQQRMAHTPNNTHSTSTTK